MIIYTRLLHFKGLVMKKNVFIVIAAALLFGCGSEEPQKVAEAPKQPEVQQAPPVQQAPEPEVKPSCPTGEPIFACSIKKKPLTYCQQDVSDTQEVVLSTKIDGKEVVAVASDAGKKSPIKIQTVFDKPMSYDTAYFEDNGYTYALTRCYGMCSQPPWLTIFQGDKKVAVAQCDEDSVEADNFEKQYKTDKKGRMIKNALYQEKKTNLNFDAP